MNRRTEPDSFFEAWFDKLCPRHSLDKEQGDEARTAGDYSPKAEIIHPAQPLPVYSDNHRNYHPGGTPRFSTMSAALVLWGGDD